MPKEFRLKFEFTISRKDGKDANSTESNDVERALNQILDCLKSNEYLTFQKGVVTLEDIT